MPPLPSPVLGTMTMGVEGQVKYDGVVKQLQAFVAAAAARGDERALVDTARVYQIATPDGDTETLLGKALASHPELRSRVSIATKAINQVPPHLSLSRESVLQQCETSLAKLQLPSVDLYYLHAPDVKSDLDETLAAIAELHKAGKIKAFGLSNFAAWQVVDIWHRCASRGYVRPTVYQGMYNVITRDMERELVPVVRQFGIKLYMYNPLAGGLLTGRYTTKEDITTATAGRFSPEFDRAFGGKVQAGKMYQARYAKDPNLEAVRILREACAAAGVSMVHAALRWLLHHSAFQPGDGVIFGASRAEHLEANLAAWGQGPLPAAVVAACDAAADAARPAVECYFRGYGAKPGGTEGFLAALKARPGPPRL